MKIYFLEAFFLILLRLHQTIKTSFSVASAREMSDNKVACLTSRPPLF